MYSICYVLTDNEKLVYYNELLISLASLRKHENDCPVVILTDEMTAEEIRKREHNDLEELKAELRVIKTPDVYSQEEKSRFIKTSMREYIDGDFLFLDTDTIVAEPLKLCPPEELAIALDYNVPLKQRPDSDIQRLSKKNESCGYTLDIEWPYYNSGCIWAKDTERVHVFFHEWHEEWKRCREKNNVIDQPSLNYINRLMGGFIQELDGAYNFQISGNPTPINLFVSAKIIHYFNVKIFKIYLLQDPNIKSMGYQSDAVQAIISSPKSAFFPSLLIPLEVKQQMDDVKQQMDDFESFRKTSIICVLDKLYKKYETLFKLIDYPFKLLRKLHSKLK